MIVLSASFYDELANRLADLMEKRLIKLCKAAVVADEAEALLTVRECAQRLKLSEKTILNRIGAHLMPATNYGSDKRPRWRVTSADLNRFRFANARKG